MLTKNVTASGGAGAVDGRQVAPAAVQRLDVAVGAAARHRGVDEGPHAGETSVEGVDEEARLVFGHVQLVGQRPAAHAVHQAVGDLLGLLALLVAHLPLLLHSTQDILVRAHLRSLRPALTCLRVDQKINNLHLSFSIPTYFYFFLDLSIYR